MCSQALSTCFGRLRVDQHESKHAWLRAGVDRCVHGAALNDDVALSKMHRFAVVQLQVALTRQQDGVIKRLRAVHELGRTRSKFGDPHHCPLP